MKDNNTGNQVETLPSTLDGLKKMAKRIKRETGCKHGDALETAAKNMGYGSYTHARRELNDDGRP